MNVKLIIGLLMVTIIVVVASIKVPYLTLCWITGFYGSFGMGFFARNTE